MNMDEEICLEDFLVTKKQKAFEHNFFKHADKFEKWEEVDFDGIYENERTFVVEAEDIKIYSEGIADDNPLFNDEKAARNGPYKELIAHPLFLTPIGFWFTGDGGPGSWVKTPGAINPGQKIEFYEPIRVGDVITQKAKFFDKWIKRGKRYLTYESEFWNQEKKLVAKWWITLIIPKSKEKMSHQF
ncbi:MaoC family dehydratase N-terminal domain-containing protein [bacterium]|nr:MaoC family dehydratase N-terminal domain-containing protein [bacterium]